MPDTVEQFAARIKSKYPEYKDVPDADLTQKIIDKYPEYKDQVSFDTPPGTSQGLMDMYGNAAKGAYENLKSLVPGISGMAAEGGPPALGAAIGGALGAPLGPGGVIGGAALGGAAGGLANRVYRQAVMGEKAPDLPQAALQTAIDAGAGATQEAAPMVNEARNIGPSVTGQVRRELTQAIKPAINKPNFQANFSKSIPEVAARGPIRNSQDLLDVIPEAKKQLWDKYSAALAGAGEGAAIDGNKIADEMISTINKRFRTQNPTAAARIEEIANTYRHPIPLSEAEDFLHSANGELGAYYAKNKVKRVQAMKDPEVAHVVKEADALRSELYSKLDEIPGKDAGELKRKYGALTELQDALLDRKVVADRANADSLAEQISFARGMGNIGESILNLHGGTALRGAANIATARYLKNRNQFDNVIQRAFEHYNAGLQNEPFISEGSVKLLSNLARQTGGSE